MGKNTPSLKYRNVYWYEAKGSRLWGAVADHGMVNGKRVRPRKEGFAKEKEARDWQIRELAQGPTAKPKGDVTLGQWADDWLLLRSAELRPGTVAGYRRALDLFAALRDRPLGDIGVAEIELELARLRGKYTAGTVRHARRVLSICCNAAVAMEVLDRNRVANTRPPAEERPAEVYLTAEQVTQVLVAAMLSEGEEWYLPLRVLAETWMRLGELQALAWEHLGERSLRIERTVREDGAGGWYLGDTAKSAASVRTIVIGAELADLLHQERDRARWSGHPLMFCEPTGELLSRNRIRNALERCCIAAGVPVASPHDLRHAGASMAIRGDARRGILPLDPKVVSERLGHTDVTFTYDRYVHKNQKDHEAAADLVAGLLSGS